MQNRLSIPLCRLLLGLCAAGALPARAQAPAPELRTGRSGRASMYSVDRRFMVSGLSSSENMVLAGRLADLAAQVEKATISGWSCRAATASTAKTSSRRPAGCC
jgi:hypothetical protein